MAVIFDMDEIEANASELESVKQQHIEMDFQTNNELWTVIGFLLGTDHVNKLSKLAPAVLNHKQI